MAMMDVFYPQPFCVVCLLLMLLEAADGAAGASMNPTALCGYAEHEGVFCKSGWVDERSLEVVDCSWCCDEQYGNSEKRVSGIPKEVCFRKNVNASLAEPKLDVLMEYEPCTHDPENVMAGENMTVEPNVVDVCFGAVSRPLVTTVLAEMNRFSVSRGVLGVPVAWPMVCKCSLAFELFKTMCSCMVLDKSYPDMCWHGLLEKVYTDIYVDFAVFKTMCWRFVVDKVYKNMCLEYFMEKNIPVMCFEQLLYEFFNMFVVLFKNMCLAFYVMFYFFKTIPMFVSGLVVLGFSAWKVVFKMCDISDVLHHVFRSTRCWIDPLRLRFVEASAVLAISGWKVRPSTLSGMMAVAFVLLAERTEGRMAVVLCGLALLGVLHVCLKRSMLSHLSCGIYKQDSRIAKRRECRKLHFVRRQMIVLIFLGGMSTAHCMDQEQVLQQVSILAQAATRAATAAERALADINVGRASDGLQAASRILKSPDTFDGNDVMNFIPWKNQFASWLSFGDNRFSDRLEKIEKLTSAPSIASYPEEEKEMARKLYAVLGSYLRGRCSQMVRSCSSTKDGFLLWYQLIQEFIPSTRSRSLALAQALAQYPVFSKDRSVLESILQYEQTIQHFEEASGSTYPEELKSATLIRCCGNKLREHLQLSITESSTYKEIREKIMSYEKVSKAWSQETILRQIQADSQGDASGPTPMDVDRVEKGKGKGKKGDKGGKGQKGGWWNNFWSFGKGKKGDKGGKSKGRGRGKGKNGKGKGKSKGKKGGKNKGGKDRVAENQCAVCFEYGHWSRECPSRMVNQVQESAPPPTNQASSSNQPPSQPTRTPSSSYHSSSTTNSTVRRIFNLGMPSISSSSSSNVRVVFEEIPEEIPVHEVQAVHGDGGDEDWIILDSGSDVSLLPCRFQPDEKDTKNHNLRNCQGGSLKTTGSKDAELIVLDHEGNEILLRHQFITADVQTGLVSLGSLYQQGWYVAPSQSGPLLTSPGLEVQIPVHFRKNSLAIKAHVRCVTASQEEEDILYTRAIMVFDQDIEDHPLNSWETSLRGHPFFKTRGTNFIDPRAMCGEYWQYRTTLIRGVNSEESTWLLVHGVLFPLHDTVLELR